MNFKSLIFISLSFLSISSRCQDILDVSELGQLNLKYTAVKKVDSLRLHPIKATVTHKTGEAFQLVAPFEPQRHQFLVKNGDYVESGAAVMQLSGSEVHHFLEQFEAAKSLFNLTRSRYNKNKKLVKQKAISNDKWLAMTQEYFDNKIAYGHYRHFNELVHSIKSEDEIVIKAPLDGYFFYPDSESIRSGELKLGQVLPKNSLRLQAYVSIDDAKNLQYFETKNCLIAVDEVSKVSEGYFVKSWSQPITQACQLSFGQSIRVIPHLAIHAYQVPKSSIFTIDRKTLILIKKGLQLHITGIDILDSNDNYYFVNCEDNLDKLEVLYTSVAAVQGVLMGLGGE